MDKLIYIICTTLPSHVIALYQYWRFPWRSRRLALALVALNVALKFMAVNWAIGAGASVKAVELLFALMGFAIYLCTLRVSPAKQLFTFVLIVDYLLVVRGMASFLVMRIWDAHPQSWQGSLICMIIYLLTLPPMLVNFRKTAHAVEDTAAPAFWRCIWIAPGFTTALMLMFTDVYEPADSASLRFLIAHVALLVCMLLVYFMMVRSIDLIRRQALREERLRQNELLLEFQRSQYAHLKLSMDELRQAYQAQHRQQQAISALLDAGDIDALRGYMEQSAADMSVERAHRYCANNAIDALLRFYQTQALRLGARMEIAAQLPDALPIPEPDACVVMGNLLENAMEACANQPQPCINISARADESLLELVVTNTAPGSPSTRSDGAFVSSKHPGEGVGTQSVRYIAQRYGGSADFSWSDGVFNARVRLCGGQRPQDECAADPMAR